MAKPLVPDELWAVIEPLLPPERPKPKGGRPPTPDRKALTGILFVLKTGIQWEDLPQEMSCGCGMTCWRRLRDWQKAGVWDDLHAVLSGAANGRSEVRTQAFGRRLQALVGLPQLPRAWAQTSARL